MIKFRFAPLLLVLMLSVSSIFAQYAPLAKGELVVHKYYSLDYSEEHEQPSWVYYILTPDHITGAVTRTNDFRPDTKVSTGSAALSDYKSSGYDRGHLMPAGDRSFSREAMSESFYMSNMSPQAPSLNRVGWRLLEQLVRKWAHSYKELHIVTGAVLDSSITKRIGANNVSVPTYYYKVIYAPQKGEMIGFIMPNEKLLKPTKAYATTVDEVEKIIGIDLFYQLDDVVENALEGAINIDAWGW